MANRLNAGMRLLKTTSGYEWEDLRYVSFVEPAIDLLLVCHKGEDWAWVQLSGTSDANAALLTGAVINDRLREINDTHVGRVIN